MNFLNRFFSPIFLVFSIFILIYTFYKSEIYWNGENREFYLNYYILSFSLIFFSFITFFFNKLFKEYLIIIFISITTGLYFFEAFLYFKEYLQLENKVKQYKNNTGKKYDKRTRIEVYNDFKKK